MLRADHPELLAPDWVPPVLVARSVPLARALARLSEPPTPAGRAPAIAVLGASGSGSSAVARRAALDLLAELRRLPNGPHPVFAPVRVRTARGPAGVASALLRALDPEFVPRGFPVAELLGGFLRRLVRRDQGAIVLLDDIGPDAPDLGPIVRGLLRPARYLPEGVDRAPPIWLLLAGAPEARSSWERIARAGAPIGEPIRLSPYTDREVEAIARDRAMRALGRPMPPGWAEAIARRAVALGGGARRTMELLRRELLEPSLPPRRPELAVRSGERPLAVEPRLLVALERATSKGPALLHTLREIEARLASAEGVRPLPTTTLWRRIVRLEAAGILRREVRAGGDGGTRSSLELLQPIEAIGFTGRPDSPRGALEGFATGLGDS